MTVMIGCDEQEYKSHSCTECQNSWLLALSGRMFLCLSGCNTKFLA